VAKEAGSWEEQLDRKEGDIDGQMRWHVEQAEHAERIHVQLFDEEYLQGEQNSGKPQSAGINRGGTEDPSGFKSEEDLQHTR